MADNIRECADEGMVSEFCESVLEFVERQRHVTDRQREGVERWLKNWRSREDR